MPLSQAFIKPSFDEDGPTQTRSPLRRVRQQATPAELVFAPIREAQVAPANDAPRPTPPVQVRKIRAEAVSPRRHGDAFAVRSGNAVVPALAPLRPTRSEIMAAVGPTRETTAKLIALISIGVIIACSATIAVVLLARPDKQAPLQTTIVAPRPTADTITITVSPPPVPAPATSDDTPPAEASDKAPSPPKVQLMTVRTYPAAEEASPTATRPPAKPRKRRMRTARSRRRAWKLRRRRAAAIDVDSLLSAARRSRSARKPTLDADESDGDTAAALGKDWN